MSCMEPAKKGVGIAMLIGDEESQSEVQYDNDILLVFEENLFEVKAMNKEQEKEEENDEVTVQEEVIEIEVKSQERKEVKNEMEKRKKKKK